MLRTLATGVLDWRYQDAPRTAGALFRGGNVVKLPRSAPAAISECLAAFVGVHERLPASINAKKATV